MTVDSLHIARYIYVYIGAQACRIVDLIREVHGGLQTSKVAITKLKEEDQKEEEATRSKTFDFVIISTRS